MIVGGEPLLIKLITEMLGYVSQMNPIGETKFIYISHI